MSFCAATHDLGVHLADIDRAECDERAFERIKERLIYCGRDDRDDVQQVFVDAMLEEAWPSLIDSYRMRDDLAFMRTLRAAVDKRIEPLVNEQLKSEVAA